MELFERIRRDWVRMGWGVRRLSREYRVHRRDVRQALANARPPARKQVERGRPVLGPLRAVIDAILETDRQAPRKQRHTARRIWQRLVSEHGSSVAESTVRAYVQMRRREMWGTPEVMVPLYHEPGEEAECDLGESVIEFAWGRETVAFFEMRACSSGAVFHWPLRAMTQQAFLEAHCEAFEHFQGVFAKVRYDNLTQAVRKVLRGRERVESERFTVMRSHYLFEAVYCRPGKEGAHEKGGVEGEVGYFRRNFLTPVPKVSGWAELEKLCRQGAERELERRLDQRPETAGQQWERERPLLRRLPADRMETRLRTEARVDQKGRVTVHRNRYSAPVTLSGLRVEVEVSSAEVAVLHRGNEVARHERLYGIGKDRLRLDHYLEVLKSKPGAFAASLPLRQAVIDGSFPPCYQEFWRRLVARLGESEGARQMVDVLFLHRRYPLEAVRGAVAQALTAGAYEFGAVAVLVRGEQAVVRPAVPYLEVIVNPQVPVPDCREYDQLLTLEVVP